MKLLRLAVPSVLFASALAACSQPDDVPALQEEATQVARSYQARFEELAHRKNELVPDGLSGTTARAYQQAESTINEYQNQLRQVPVRIQAGVKSHSPDELHKLIDDMHERFEDGVRAANTAVTAVEDQIALAHRGLGPIPAAQEPAHRPHAQAGDGSSENAPVQ